ncbi:hypothetical protein IFM89_030893 [Coptis chinensis]|uniref:Uncharacterized protein n=1 Tax=Coptis chinensis TaxID=261450 RepID=A0A835HWL1_9MAGN|nr:hypothetical protein IFM89_030893 [Coptis chinensis]
MLSHATEKEESHNPTRSIGKETANSDQSEEPPRKGKNRNKRRNRNKDTLTSPSGTKDSQGMPNNNTENSEVFHDTSSELVDNNDRAYNDATSLKTAAATDEANRVVQENAERDKVPDPLSEGQTSPIQEGEVTTLAMYNSPEFVIPLQRHSAIPSEQQEDLQASQNKFQVLDEAESLLRLTSWADMEEELDEESTKRKENGKLLRRSITSPNGWSSGFPLFPPGQE